MFCKILLMLVATAALSLPAAELKFSGRLAQSQPENKPPIRESQPRGVTAEPGTKNAFALFGSKLYRLKTDGSADIVLDVQGHFGHLYNDGKDVYTVDSSQTILRLVSENGVWRLARPVLVLPHPGQAFTLAEAGSARGFAAKGKFFNLNKKKREIFAYGADGKFLGIVLRLPELPQKSDYFAIILQGGTGDMLVSAYYPDCTFHRYSPDGTERMTGGWPVRGTWIHYGNASGDKTLCYENGLSVYPEEPVTKKHIVSFGSGRDTYTFGAASDGAGGFFLAVSTGVKHYPAGSEKEAARRIGGSGNVVDLALNKSDIVVSTGNLLYGLKLDDAPDTPFLSTGNESWRTGGNWSSRTRFLVPCGTGFLAYDVKNKQMWFFDPGKSGKVRWVKREEKFNAPSALSAYDGKVFAAENGVFGPVSSVRALAVLDSETVAAAAPDGVSIVKSGTLLRKIPLAGVKSLAALRNGYFVAATGKELILIGPDGKIGNRQASGAVLLSGSGRWLVASDPSGSVLLRYKLVE